MKKALQSSAFEWMEILTHLIDNPHPHLVSQKLGIVIISLLLFV